MCDVMCDVMHDMILEYMELIFWSHCIAQDVVVGKVEVLCFDLCTYNKSSVCVCVYT